EEITEVPTVSTHAHRHHHVDNNEITEVPTVSTHAHRHHHVDNNTTPSTPLASTESTQQEQTSTTTSLASQTPTQTSPNAFTATATGASATVKEGEIEEEEEKLTDSILPDATHRESTTYKSPETTPTSNLAEKATRSPFAVIPEEPRASATTTEMPDDYDEEDDDEEIISRTSIYDAVPTVSPTTESSPTTTTPAPTTTTTTERIVTTTEYIEPEPVNSPPMIKNRLPKQALTAGKPFSLHVPLETFYDNEDVYNLQLVLYDKNDHPLKANSWIQFNKETREIYGFANHEISIGIRLNEKFSNSVDWQMKVVRAIVSTMGDASMNNVVVREIRHSQQDPNSATFVYTNETLPKDRCVEEELEGLVKRLHTKDFSDVLMPEISVKSVTGQPIGPCQKHSVPKPKPTPTISKNFAPVPRNQVDRVNATVGQLLIFQVPQDTFYDPEDGTNLRLSLLSLEGSKLDAKHWLQFDSKNQEFYGIPKPADVGQREYLLVAEDREGLTATDALVVVVNHAPKRDYSALFEMTLGISNENFNNSATQRRFIERVAQAFGDVSTANIQVRSIRALHHSGHTLVSFYNTTIYRQHHICPHDEIEVLRNVLMYPDASVRDRVRETIGTEFNLLSVNLIPAGTCQGTDTMIHDPFVPIKTEDKPAPTFKDDYLLTFVLPAVIILAMLLLASIIACVLHRRRLTGKMELGDEEERRSFRSKGIPVIFQDELDEKPEIGNKSPVILKDEKPPLLPPSYNSTNPDGDNEDVDEYVPPPAVIIGGRESRGKSPVTPSYRKPPPYVSP
uniref:Dystroglycan 1 n=1 Tax=Lutzomyia longipalpis TaxID=7200 RepID=A0A1B0CK61_LUTLO